MASLGQREFDEILGGGHVLGTVLLIESDSYSDYATTIIKYEISESISMEHATIILSGDEINDLPHNRNFVSKDSDTNRSEDFEVSKKVADVSSNLKIAWQYGKYLPTESDSDYASTSVDTDLRKVFCCSYDLSRK